MLKDYGIHYYEHLCTIEDEKDVLETDIKGRSCFADLKRFWYNLFLLSYTDSRSRYFYTSTHAMKSARASHFRQYRTSIHPYSTFRTFWDCVVLHSMLLNKILFHVNSSMIHFTHISSHYLAVVVELIIIIDLFINARTGYLINDSRQINMDPSHIMIHYLSKDLAMNVASAIPLEAIMFLRYGYEIECAPCKCNLLVATLKLISVITVIRLFQVSKYWNRKRESPLITTSLKFIGIAALGLVIMLQVLNFADALSIIYIVKNNDVDRRSYLSIVLMFRHSYGVSDNFIFLCLEFSRICKTFLLYGYGLQPNKTPFDKLSAIISFVLAFTFHVWAFIGCYFCVTRGMSPQEHNLANKEITLNILRSRQLPDVISKKIEKYYECNMTIFSLTEARNGLYLSLPSVLKKEIMLSCYRRMLFRIPMFSEWPQVLIDELVTLLKGEVYLKKDVVDSAGSKSEGLVIVESGMLAVHSARMEVTGHLIDGDFFGELSLVTDKVKRMSTVIAETYCRMLFLDKNLFRKLMRSQPELFFQMKYSLQHGVGSEETINEANVGDHFQR